MKEQEDKKEIYILMKQQINSRLTIKKWRKRKIHWKIRKEIIKIKLVNRENWKITNKRKRWSFKLNFTVKLKKVHLNKRKEKEGRVNCKHR